MLNNPRFSIITATLNSKRFLLRNIESVQTQAFKDYEHIFIDGMSTDGTKALIKSFLKRDSKIKLFDRKANGISDAMNEGIKRAKGEIIIHLHSDDWFSSKKTLNSVNKLFTKNKKLDWIYGKICVVEEDETKVGVFPRNRLFQLSNPNLLKYFNYIPHQATFLKRSVFEKYGDFDKRLPSQMDLDLWLRIATQTNWTFLDEVLTNYTIRQGAQSSSLQKKTENQMYFMKVHSRYLNRYEMKIFRFVNFIVDHYNRTRR